MTMRLRAIVWKREPRSFSEKSERQAILDGVYVNGGQVAQIAYNAQDGTGTVGVWMVWYGEQSFGRFRRRYAAAIELAHSARH